MRLAPGLLAIRDCIGPNARKDGFHAAYFGEGRGEKDRSDPINFDRIDDRPELAVGRWPVDLEAEVSMAADKTMAEGRAVSSGQGNRRMLSLLCVALRYFAVAA